VTVTVMFQLTFNISITQGSPSACSCTTVKQIYCQDQILTVELQMTVIYLFT